MRGHHDFSEGSMRTVVNRAWLIGIEYGINAIASAKTLVISSGPTPKLGVADIFGVIVADTIEIAVLTLVTFDLEPSCGDPLSLSICIGFAESYFIVCCIAEIDFFRISGV